MQFLMSVIDDSTESATGTEMAAIDAFNNRLRAGGFWVIEATDRSAALAIAAAGSEACHRRVEVRPFLAG